MIWESRYFAELYKPLTFHFRTLFNHFWYIKWDFTRWPAIGEFPQESHKQMHSAAFWHSSLGFCFLFNHYLYTKIPQIPLDERLSCETKCILVINDLSRDTAFPTRLHARPAKTQISLRIHVVWSASSQGTFGSQKSGASYGVQRGLWSACADAQADQSLRWAHIQSCCKCCDAAYFIPLPSGLTSLYLWKLHRWYMFHTLLQTKTICWFVLIGIYVTFNNI